MKTSALVVALSCAVFASSALAAQSPVSKAPPPQEELQETPRLEKPVVPTAGRGAPEKSGMHYFTAYSHHIEPGELEIMLLQDFTTPSGPKRDEGQEEYFSQMLMVEYAPAAQLAFEFMLEGFEDIGTGDEKFTGYRLEARYRLFEREVPLNPTLYVEYEDLDPETRFKMEVSGWVRPPYDEDGDEPSREKILESRLLLSQDFGRWNVTFNWLNESDLQGDVTAFGYMLGVGYRLAEAHEAHHGEHASTQAPLIQPVALGVELVGALGDSKDFGLTADRQEHYLQPSIMLHVGGTMVGLGMAFGLTDASDDMLRLSVGWHF
ncbi:MAG: hypothetical protein HYY16_18025 [Planctomycetes bacterium]|nr:hypothetical protein [Planctomycetota bacterium]